MTLMLMLMLLPMIAVFGLGIIVAETSSGEATASTRPLCNDILEVLMEFLVVLLVFFLSTAVMKSKRRNPKKEKPVTGIRSPRTRSNEAAGAAQGVSAASIGAEIENVGPEVATTNAGLRSRAPQGASAWRERAERVGATSSSNANNGLAIVRLAQFIEVNELDPACAKLLRRLPAPQAEWVMDEEFIIQVDPTRGTASSKVVKLVRISNKKPEEFWQQYPAAEDIQKRLDNFVQINNLDKRCLLTLSKLPKAALRRVMDQEYYIRVDENRGTASAKVIGRILQVRDFN